MMKHQWMADTNVAVHTQKAEQHGSTSLIQAPSKEDAVLHSFSVQKMDVFYDQQEAEQHVKACQLECEDLRCGTDTGFAQQEVYDQPVGWYPQGWHCDNSG